MPVPRRPSLLRPVTDGSRAFTAAKTLDKTPEALCFSKRAGKEAGWNGGEARRQRLWGACLEVAVQQIPHDGVRVVLMQHLRHAKGEQEDHAAIDDDLQGVLLHLWVVTGPPTQVNGLPPDNRLQVTSMLRVWTKDRVWLLQGRLSRNLCELWSRAWQCSPPMRQQFALEDTLP